MIVVKSRQAGYTLAHAVGTDAGNASMRQAGRTVWNQDDYNAAVAAFNRVLPGKESK